MDLSPELPNEVMDIARKQGEDPDRVCAHLQELRDMIYGKRRSSFSFRKITKSQFSTEKGYCTPHRTDDEFLIRFLRARFFKVENAYKLVRFKN